MEDPEVDPAEEWVEERAAAAQAVDHLLAVAVAMAAEENEAPDVIDFQEVWDRQPSISFPKTQKSNIKI